MLTLNNQNTRIVMYQMIHNIGVNGDDTSNKEVFEADRSR